MKEGTYKVHFSAPSGAYGNGVIDIRNGQLSGGDIAFFYTGQARIEKGTLRATLRVQRHGTRHVGSVLGGGNLFDLELSGPASDDSFQISGSIPGRPEARVAVSGWRKP